MLKPEYQGKVKPKEIVEWSRNQMAAYKYPRIVEIRESLPNLFRQDSALRAVEQELESVSLTRMFTDETRTNFDYGAKEQLYAYPRVV